MVEVHFSELESKKPGERVFDVKIQGKTVLDNFDIVKEAGRTDKEIVKTFSGVTAGETLKLELIPVNGNTILSGIELIEEKLVQPYKVSTWDSIPADAKDPDGHWYVELGTQVDNGDEPWLWRKNGHAYSSGAWPPTVFDHYGVDLNRNFDFHWGTRGVQWEPRSQTYPGPSAASEPETQAVQNLLSSVFSGQVEAWDAGAASDNADGVFVSLHQHGELVLWPWWDTMSTAASTAKWRLSPLLCRRMGSSQAGTWCTFAART